MSDDENFMEMQIAEAVGRAWTHEVNEHKVVDVDLAMAVVAEVLAILPVIFLDNGLEIDIATGEVTKVR